MDVHTHPVRTAAIVTASLALLLALLVGVGYGVAQLVEMASWLAGS